MQVYINYFFFRTTFSSVFEKKKYEMNRWEKKRREKRQANVWSKITGIKTMHKQRKTKIIVDEHKMITKQNKTKLQWNTQHKSIRPERSAPMDFVYTVRSIIAFTDVHIENTLNWSDPRMQSAFCRFVRHNDSCLWCFVFFVFFFVRSSWFKWIFIQDVWC